MTGPADDVIAAGDGAFILDSSENSVEFIELG